MDKNFTPPLGEQTWNHKENEVSPGRHGVGMNDGHGKGRDDVSTGKPGRKGAPKKRPPASAGGPRAVFLSVLDYTSPWAVIARATLMKPAIFAPLTRLPGEPNSSAASEQSRYTFLMIW